MQDLIPYGNYCNLLRTNMWAACQSPNVGGSETFHTVLNNSRTAAGCAVLGRRLAWVKLKDLFGLACMQMHTGLHVYHA